MTKSIMCIHTELRLRIAWPRDYKMFVMKFILLINFKMPTIVGILAFISMINTTSKSLKAKNGLIILIFSIFDLMNF